MRTAKGEYSEVGGRVNRNTEADRAIQEVIVTRRAIDRILRYAFDLARTRKKDVTSATKSNGIVYAMPFWDERFAAISKEYTDVKADQFHIDILTAHFVAHPDWFRRRGRVKSVWRHPVRPRRRRGGLDGAGAFGKFEPRARIPIFI